MTASSGPPLFPNELNNRVNFKLNAARRHLDNLRKLEGNSPGRNLASTRDRMQVEMETDEFLYHLVGVKDALLQEINLGLHLGLAKKDVTLEEINRELNQNRPNAREITKEICNVVSNEDNPLWLVNELHNHSEHRAMVGWGILVVDGESVIVSLNDPRTDGDVIRDGQGRRISIIQYLEESYTNIEKLQKTVRDKISQYAV